MKLIFLIIVVLCGLSANSQKLTIDTLPVLLLISDTSENVIQGNFYMKPDQHVYWVHGYEVRHPYARDITGILTVKYYLSSQKIMLPPKYVIWQVIIKKLPISNP